MSLSVRPYSRHLGDCIKSMAQLQAKLMWNRGLWELCAVVGGGGGGSVEEWSCFILSSLIFLSLLNSFCLFSTFCLFYLSRQAELEGVGRPVGMRMREQCKKGGDRWNEIKTSSMVSGNERKEDVEEERKQRVEQCYSEKCGVLFSQSSVFVYIWRPLWCRSGFFSRVLNFVNYDL